MRRHAAHCGPLRRVRMGSARWGAGAMPKLTEGSSPPSGPRARRRIGWPSTPSAGALGSAPRPPATRSSSSSGPTPRPAGSMREPLGAWGSITVEQARAAARARLGRVAQGVNPAAERAAAKAADEARRAAGGGAGGSPVHPGCADRRLGAAALGRQAGALRAPRPSGPSERCSQAHLDRPAASLTHAAVTAVLDALAGAGRAAMAGRTMAYGRACYGWAVKRRRLPVNPFAGLPVIEGANPTRDRVLTDGDRRRVARRRDAGQAVRAHRAAADADGAAAGGGGVAAVVRTIARPGDMDLAGARSKNGKAHVVHLSEPARAILADVPRSPGRTWCSARPAQRPPSGFSKAKLMLDAAMAKEALAVPQPPSSPGAARQRQAPGDAGMAFPRLPPHRGDVARRGRVPAARRGPAAEPCGRQHPGRGRDLPARRVPGRAEGGAGSMERARLALRRGQR